MIKVNDFYKKIGLCVCFKLLVESETGSHVGLEDLCDGVDVGCCPDIQAQIHPDNDDGEYDCDDVDSENKMSVSLSKKMQR